MKLKVILFLIFSAFICQADNKDSLITYISFVRSVENNKIHNQNIDAQLKVLERIYNKELGKVLKFTHTEAAELKDLGYEVFPADGHYEFEIKKNVYFKYFSRWLSSGHLDFELEKVKKVINTHLKSNPSNESKVNFITNLKDSKELLKCEYIRAGLLLSLIHI